MIIVQLNGGQANQMFQYAAARRLALKHNVELKLDLSFFGTQEVDTPRTYKLDTLNIQAEIATEQEVSAVKSRKPAVWLRAFYKLTGKGFPYAKLHYLKERHFQFDPEVLDAGDDVYLEGFWQSQKYFQDVASQIRSEFQVITEVNDYNQKLLDLVNSTESIAIHVRRGDYVTSKNANDFHGICSMEYYQTAIDKIKSQVKSPQFIIFSDDPDWAEQNIITGAPTVVSRNDVDHGHDDLRIMSNCKHFIIANSSFSWWGAWLGSAADKQVYAPQQWFKDKSVNTSDIIPESWHKL